jgi:hypothetical protein
MLGVPGHQLVLPRRVVGARVPDQLDLVELMHPEDAACVLPRCTGLTPEARGIRDEPLRKGLPFQDFIPVQVGDRDFGRGNQEDLFAADRVKIFLELGELAGARHRGAIDENRRPDFLIAALSMEVDEEAHQRANEPGPVAAEDGEPGTADLRRASEIDEPVLLGDLPVRTNAFRRSRSAPLAHDDVVRLVPLRDVREGEVWNVEKDLLDRDFDLAKLSLKSCDLVAQRAATGDQVVGWLPGAFSSGNFLGC